MAEAILTTIPRQVTVEEEFVVLTLTKEEARALRDVTARISGSPTKSRRGLLDNISNALYKVGFRFFSTDDIGRYDTLRFLDEIEQRAE